MIRVFNILRELNLPETKTQGDFTVTLVFKRTKTIKGEVVVEKPTSEYKLPGPIA